MGTANLSGSMTTVAYGLWRRTFVGPVLGGIIGAMLVEEPEGNGSEQLAEPLVAVAAGRSAGKGQARMASTKRQTSVLGFDRGGESLSAWR